MLKLVPKLPFDAKIQGFCRRTKRWNKKKKKKKKFWDFFQGKAREKTKQMMSESFLKAYRLEREDDKVACLGALI